MGAHCLIALPLFLEDLLWGQLHHLRHVRLAAQAAKFKRALRINETIRTILSHPLLGRIDKLSELREALSDKSDRSIGFRKQSHDHERLVPLPSPLPTTLTKRVIDLHKPLLIYTVDL